MNPRTEIFEPNAAPCISVFSDDHVFRFPLFPDRFDEVVLPIDKPGGWTSFDVVKKLRGMLRIRKVGHAGTLDPMATGLLICLVGKATRRMESYMQLEKTYIGVMRLGETTPSYDAETDVIERRPADAVLDDQIRETCNALVGEIDQVPPMYSAVKVGGERLYKKARRGENIERKSRRVSVYAFDVIERTGSDVRFHVRCSKGTYIRTLAHDVGQRLGVGAHLIALRRTAIGPFSVEDAWNLEALSDATARSHGNG